MEDHMHIIFQNGSTFHDPKIWWYLNMYLKMIVYALMLWIFNTQMGMPYTHTQGIVVLSNPSLATQHLVLV